MTTRSNKRILVIAIPGIGDALLATPLIRSLKSRYPNSKIDLLVREGSEGIVAGNPDIEQVKHVPRRLGYYESFLFLVKIYRKYNLAISTASGDRWFMICQIAAPQRALVVPKVAVQELWKRLGRASRLVEDFEINTVEQNLRIVDALGIERKAEVVSPSSPHSLAKLTKLIPFRWQKVKYAVVHLVPSFEYKKWPLPYWQDVIRDLCSRGYYVVLTSGPAKTDTEYTRSAVKGLPPGVANLAGKLNFADVSLLVSKAAVYLGPDTSTTHLAAATGTPVITIYGQTNRKKWAPWPKGWNSRRNPFRDIPTQGAKLEREKNISLISSPCECSARSKKPEQCCALQSKCLAAIQPDTIIKELDFVLGSSKKILKACAKLVA